MKAIARRWRGWASAPADADAYASHIRLRSGDRVRGSWPELTEDAASQLAFELWALQALSPRR